MRYGVISACDHYDCSYGKVEFIMDALSEEAAWVSANALNRTSEVLCPFCKNRLGYFPEITENK
ncbi:MULTISPECIES: hypothetical protein [unclassified Paenibacillus]|uniref:hypothetical protein n=1 Tax=unclassified Paenibacillus TaxID=185978 RepID=UPI00117FAEFF|nr:MULTISPECIES: hypothetical protein [unclassified Paenibacillus]